MKAKKLTHAHLSVVLSEEVVNTQTRKHGTEWKG